MSDLLTKYERILVVHRDSLGVAGTGIIEKVTKIVEFLLLSKWCNNSMDIRVHMEVSSLIFEQLRENNDLSSRILPYPNESCIVNCRELPSIDLVISIGGDGTVLHAAWLIQGQDPCPPILPLHCGSLGFLNVDDSNVEVLPFYLLSDEVEISERTRLFCSLSLSPSCSPYLQSIEDRQLSLENLKKQSIPTILDVHKEKILTNLATPQVTSIESSESHPTEGSLGTGKSVKKRSDLNDSINLNSDDSSLKCISELQSRKIDVNRNGFGRQVQSICMRLDHNILNEVVVERGASPYLLTLIITVDDILLTTLRADGLIIASATGSTAYSLSAGGPIMHPGLPAILLTPICAHTLGMRPIVLPSKCHVIVSLGPESRPGQAIFDGRDRITIRAGDSLCVQTSPIPLRVMSRCSLAVHWAHNLATCFRWSDQSSAWSTMPH